MSEILLQRIFKVLAVVVIFISITQAQLVPNLGGQRAGITALQFLKLPGGARGAGMGEAFVAVANDVSSLYWNPAGLAQFNENQIQFSHSEYVVDLKHEFVSLAYHLTSNDAIGISVTSLHTEDMPVTTETQPFGTGEYFSFGDVAIGVTFARKMTDQFSFGITGRYVVETLDILKMRGIVVDIGTYYWTGLGSSRFAVVVTNFGSDVSPSGEITEYNGATISSFQAFSPPTRFKIGFAMEPLQTENQRITTSLELHHPNDNAENIHLGLEYEYEKSLWFRAGVKRTIGEALFGKDNSSSNDLSFGVGFAVPLATSRLNFDYAWANFNQLGNLNVISLAVTF